MEIDEDLKKEMREIAEIVKLYPESVQGRVFDFLTSEKRNSITVENRRTFKNDGSKIGKEVENGSNESDEEEFSISEVVNAIRGSEYFDQIQAKILDKANQLNRILLCFYFVNKLYPNKGITTGIVEKITDQLRVKIGKSNVGKKIKNEQKYFSADNVRKKGAHVHYKINRNGIKEFESLIDG